MRAAAIGRPWNTARFRRFVAGRGAAAEQAAPGDWPIALMPAGAMRATGAQSHTVRLSPDGAVHQRERHPDIAATDYARLQRILDEGEVFRAGPRHAIAFLDMDGRPWRAVVKATADGSETYLQTLHKAQPHNLGAARRRLERIDRDGE